MIIVFLIDTSASMNQRVYHGGHPRFIDIAKGAVETFVKARQKLLESRQTDRYMLLTFDEPPDHIKAGWKENLNTFTTELKNLQCCSMTNIGVALKRVFEVLNINRMQTGIDAYGQGRNPYYLEPTMIILITDGGRLTTNTMNEISFLQQSTSPNLELTRDAYRWDQRLFALVLRLTGTPMSDRDNTMVPNDNSVLENMCEMTGGRSYCVTSQRTLMQCIESLLQKIQHGVVINFEKCGPDPPRSPLNEANKDNNDTEQSEHGNKITNGNSTDGSLPFRNNFPAKYNNNTQQQVPAWQSCRRLIYVRRDGQKNSCFWPIPEPFWPEPSSTSLPQRTAHPLIKFNCIGHDPSIIENLPFDKYELEPNPLTQYILGRRQPAVCWQCFVPNSSRNPEALFPFGYLKASTNLACVNLYVMPFNYPMLFPILEEIMRHRMQKLTPEVKQQFMNYMRTVPIYYTGPLRKAFEKMGINKIVCNSLLGELGDSFYNFNVGNYMKKMKTQGKAEFDKLCNEVSSKVGNNAALRRETVRILPHIMIKKELISHPALRGKFVGVDDKLKDHSDHVVAISHKLQQITKAGPQAFRNPFEIPRKNLVDHISKMRSNFLQKNLTYSNLLDDEMSHSMMVTQMGNYQEYLKRKCLLPLREIEITQFRQHTFGNPFKSEKKMIVDEADVDMQRNSSRRSNEQNYAAYKMPSRKRKAGPLPRSYVHKRIRYNSMSPTSTPPASPASSVSSCSSSDLSPPNSPMSNASEIIISCDSDDEDDHDDIREINRNSDNSISSNNNNSNENSSCSVSSIDSSKDQNIDIIFDNEKEHEDEDIVDGNLVIDDDDDDDDDVMPLLTAENEQELDGRRPFRSPSPPSLDILSSIATTDPFSNCCSGGYNNDEDDIPPPSLLPISDVVSVTNSRIPTTSTSSISSSAAAANSSAFEKVITGDVEILDEDINDNRTISSNNININNNNNNDDRVYNHNSINNNGYTDSSEALISETSNCCTDVEEVAETQQEATVDDEEDARMKSKMCMNPDQIKTCLKHNYKVKARIFRAVRSYGNNYNILLEDVKLLKGTLEMKMCVISEAIRESYKFKRCSLATKLKNLLQDYEANENTDDDYEEQLNMLYNVQLDLNFVETV